MSLNPSTIRQRDSQTLIISIDPLHPNPSLPTASTITTPTSESSPTLNHSSEWLRADEIQPASDTTDSQTPFPATPGNLEDGRAGLQASTAGTDDILDNLDYWRCWRIWITIKTLAIISIIGVSINAIVKDVREGRVCADMQIRNYNVVHIVLLAAQLVSSFALFLTLPIGARQWTFQNYQRYQVSKWTFGISVIILMGQMCMIPIGFMVVRYPTTTCVMASHLFEFTYYLILVQCIVFILFSLPVFLFPCMIALASFPSHHGVSDTTLNRLRTLTYDGETDLTLSFRHENASLKNLKSLSVTEIALTMMVEKNGIAPAAERTEQVEDSPKDLAPAHRKHDGTTIRCSNVPKAPCQPKTRKPKLNSESCIICLEGWVVGNKVAVLDCRHAYHSECIRTWLIEHSDCPCCRKPVA